MIATPAALPAESLRRILARGMQVSWPIVLLLAAINTGMALLLWVEDPRPFWQPLVTVQIYGFCIACCVNAASPWDTPNPITRLCLAVAIGTLLGLVLTILVHDARPGRPPRQRLPQHPADASWRAHGIHARHSARTRALPGAAEHAAVPRRECGQARDRT